MKLQLLFTAVILLLTPQCSLRGQNPSPHATYFRLARCDWNRTSSNQCCYPLADFNSEYVRSECNLSLWIVRTSGQPPSCSSAINEDRPEFVYRMTVTNSNSKVIRSIEWQYVFTDGETQTEVACHQFHSEQQVRPNETKTLTEYSASPPTRVISIETLPRPQSERFIEKIVEGRCV